MLEKDILEKVKKLREQIDDLRYRYHVLNDPEVTDKMYEGLMDELKKIEEKYPEIISPDSPTQRVAGKPLDKFEKIIHSIRQWSFADAFDKNDLLDWEERNMKILEKELGYRPQDLSYVCELKIDGLHVVLDYRSGILKTAATRGDGKIGENVTQNIKTIQSVPLKLKENIDIIAEGEIWLGEKMLDKINKEREKTGEIKFANPRNAAAGTIRQLDPQIVAKRKLDVTVYDISSEIENISSQEEELNKLKNLGFLTDQNWKVCKNIEQIMDFYYKLEKNKKSFSYWIDGMVIKINQKKYQDILGFTGKSPRWGIAFKFPAEQGTTQIEDVYWQVGRTGALTPVAHMKAVRLAGTTVTHATLHNYDEIKRLGVKIGDHVVVEKAGDIIPKVVRVLEKMRTGDEKQIKEPQNCPICHSPVGRKKIETKKEDSSALYCLNSKCYAQELEKIIHFVSKKAFNIDGLGEKLVEQLLNEGLIKNPADLFILKTGDLEPLERFAEKSASNLVLAIENSKKISLNRFIFALGISHVGEETAIRLANYFKKLENIQKTSLEDLEKVDDVGVKVAESIFNYFQDKDNQILLKELFENGIKIEKFSENKNDKLANKTFVITGSFENFTRDEIKEKIRKLGGKNSSSVSKKTDFVLAGEEAGTKLNKAKDLGIKILTEKDFLDLIK
jgi:DNA ligase (NAD+)